MCDITPDHKCSAKITINLSVPLVQQCYRVGLWRRVLTPICPTQVKSWGPPISKAGHQREANIYLELGTLRWPCQDEAPLIYCQRGLSETEGQGIQNIAATARSTRIELTSPVRRRLPLPKMCVPQTSVRPGLRNGQSRHWKCRALGHFRSA